MLSADEFLRRRLTRIAEIRAVNGLDPTPTLLDIEKTHILFVNSYFKPFANIAYEYSKTTPTGAVNFGNKLVQFSIPQQGDFFADMAFHVRTAAVTSGTDETSTWRWCSYPGERLLEKVYFHVNNNPLDDYTKEDYVFYRNFELPCDKRRAYMRCAGQQELKKAKVVPAGSVDSHTAIPGVGGYGSGAESLLGGQNSTTSVWVEVTNGYQTAKTTVGHAATTNHERTDILEVFMPALFWFNRDVRLAIPSVSIPYGQRFVNVEVASFTDLAQGLAIDSAGPAGGTSTSEAVAMGTDLTAGSTIPTFDLYINNLYVQPEIHDIFIRRIGFTLIRVHRRQKTRVTSLSNSNELLSQLKWAVEYMYVGFRSVDNGDTAATEEYLDGWWKFGNVSDVVTGVLLPSQGSAAGTTAIHAQFQNSLPLVNKLSVTAQGIELYKDIPAKMLNSYIPLVYGDKVTSPEDENAYMVNFCLHPGHAQPSGHINVSRSREFYLAFDNAVSAQRNVGSSAGGVDLFVHACCDNFLLISDGSAVIRYST
jgi:hypothetical protein